MECYAKKKGFVLTTNTNNNSNQQLSQVPKKRGKIQKRVEKTKNSGEDSQYEDSDEQEDEEEEEKKVFSKKRLSKARKTVFQIKQRDESLDSERRTKKW